MAYSGKFCPACGLPAWSPWIPPPIPRGPPAGFVLLNVAWVFSLLAFLVILAIATVGMFAMLSPIATGIDDIRQGATVDPGFDTTTAWTFSAWTPIGATGSLQGSGGNPGGYGEIQLEGRPGSTVRGYWSQAFTTDGSHPYLAAVRLDYRVLQTSSILQSLTIAMYVERSNGTPPAQGGDAWNVTLAQTTNWTSARSVYVPTGEVIQAVDVSSLVTRPGTYYVKVAAIALNLPGGAGTPSIVGFDNVRLLWETNAFIPVALFLPGPVLLYFTQAPLEFYIWTAAVVAVTALSLAVLVITDRRKLWAAVRAPADEMPAKLRSRSATVAIMQTFLAVLFFVVVSAIATNAPEPSYVQEIPGWYYLWALLNAPVYEEVVFRVLLIGLPLMVGSLVLRVAGLARGRVPAGMSRARYLLGSLRYLYGGRLGRHSPRVALFPALAFLGMSSTIFGFAHAPGYGDWKVLPAAFAGLAMGYVFLRHGLHAAIIWHFVNDVFIATITLVGVDTPLGVALGLGLFFLIIPGAAFFIYYALYTFRFVQDVVRPAGSRTAAVVRAAPSAYPTYAVPPGMAYAQAPLPAGPPPGTMPSGYVPATRPPGYGTSPVEYRCPRCAWVEAAYENGRFRCLRCGYLT